MAKAVLPEYLRGALAAPWPEVQAALAESAWVHEHYAQEFPPTWKIDPPHLTHARSALRGSVVSELVEELNGRRIGIWVPTELLSTYGQSTAVRDMASRKRRLYRTFISWTENPALCGGVGDRIVGQAMDDLRGRYLWLPPEHAPGQVRTIGGQDVPFGPLDGTGLWVPDTIRPSEGLVRFGVEVKNSRSILYPYSHEVWDLLAKLTGFPDVVPVLVARRIHYTTFVFFRAIGALGVPTGQQWFSPSIDADRFREVTSGLSFRDAVRFDSAHPPPALVKWFRETGRELAPAQLDKWQLAGPILDPYGELRDAGLDPRERQRLWAELYGELQGAGILPSREMEEPDVDWDWDDV